MPDIQGWTDRLEKHRKALSGLPDRLTSIRPRPDGWSCREILGHLVDSALNNLARVVQARDQDHFVFPGYDQDAWVRTQDWNGVDWLETVDLWYALNRHLARVVAAMPGEEMVRPRFPHSLHRIAWKVWPEDQPASLIYLVEDYQGHLEHHLAVLFRLGATLGAQGQSDR